MLFPCQIYDAIAELQEHLDGQHHDREAGCLDYRVIKAMATTCKLRDYLAMELAKIPRAGDWEVSVV